MRQLQDMYACAHRAAGWVLTVGQDLKRAERRTARALDFAAAYYSHIAVADVTRRVTSSLGTRAVRRAHGKNTSAIIRLRFRAITVLSATRADRAGRAC
eukprot:4826387-Pleurochrysis_carterae.AAC.9